MDNGNISELERLLQELERLDAEAGAEVERTKAAYDLAVLHQRMIRGMLRQGGRAEQPKPAPKYRRTRKVSDQKRDEILLAMTSFVRSGKQSISGIEGTFTTTDIAEATGAHQTQVNAAINELRELGAIRKVGVDPNQRNRNVYALDSDA